MLTDVNSTSEERGIKRREKAPRTAQKTSSEIHCYLPEHVRFRSQPI